MSEEPLPTVGRQPSLLTEEPNNEQYLSFALVL